MYQEYYPSEDYLDDYSDREDELRTLFMDENQEEDYDFTFDDYSQ